MSSVKDLLGRIDYPRLAGLRSLLGIDFEGEKAHVVELSREGLPFDKFSGKIVPLQSFTILIPEGSIAEKAKIIETSLEDHGVKTRFAVMSVRRTHLRIVSVKVPADVEDIEDWVHENSARLLKLPVAPSDLAFALETIEATGGGRRATIAFLRKEERDAYVALAGEAGLELLSLTSGLTDLARVCLLSPHADLTSVFRIVHVEQGAVTTLSCKEGECTGIAVEQITHPMSVVDALAKGGAVNEETKVFVSGQLSGPERAGVLLKPFGVASEFALASGLALRGLMMQEQGADFLTREEVERRETRLAQGLFRAALLVSGILLLALLLVPFVASTYLEVKNDDIDATLITSGRSNAEIAELEREAAFLKKSSVTGSSSSVRSHTAFYLHEIARLTPHDAELRSLVIESVDARTGRVLLKGHALSQNSVSDYLKSLKGGAFCREVSLRKLDVHDMERDPGGRGRNLQGVYFEIAATVNPQEIP